MPIRYLILTLLIAGCSGPAPAPVADRSPVFNQRTTTYVVRPGDTLYSIAWRFRKDFKDLARYNHIAAPYLIQPGQKVRLAVISHSPSLAKVPASSKSRGQKPTHTATKIQKPVAVTRWSWPATGTIKRPFGKNNSGVDIAVKSGTSIVTAAPGEVVYAGEGIRGYRRLVIIKHNDRYLSAYGLNHEIKVREGQKVKVGAKLADIGNRDAAGETLHFEIRKDGDPIDPGRFIKAQG